METEQRRTCFQLLGKRWSALIVQDLMEGRRRFRELLQHLPRINDKVLSQRLKELEQMGVIQRQLFAEVPVRVEYTLTPMGRGLGAVIREMERWDAAWTNGAAAGLVPAQEPQHPTEPSPAQVSVPTRESPQEQRPRAPFWRRLGL